MTNLAGKVALIPGASGGIGREVARAFVDAGCDVALAYYSNPAPTAELAEHAEVIVGETRSAESRGNQANPFVAQPFGPSKKKE